MREKLNFKRFLAAILLAIILFEVFSLVRPLPILSPTYQTPASIKAQAVSLPWPTGAQAAVGAIGYGVLATSQAIHPLPMASIAKIITALAVLSKKPLAVGQSGPTIAFDATDVSYYTSYVAQGGSVAKVVAGETISEYQALQTMLLPSANNVAESMSRWAFGTPEAYLTYAKQFVKTLGMSQTSIADASGFSPATTSTPRDLVVLGQAALANPVLAQIVGQNQATVPVVGIVKNTNWLLGSDGFVGIKTGNTDQAGGCYLFASNEIIGGQTITVVGAVMDSPSLQAAFSQGKSLADAAKANFTNQVLVKAGQVLGSYRQPWGGMVQAIAQRGLSIVAWRGEPVTDVLSLMPLRAPAKSGITAGQLSVVTGSRTSSITVVTEQAIAQPSLKWQLLRF